MVKLIQKYEITALKDKLADKRTKEYKDNKPLLDFLPVIEEDCKKYNGYDCDRFTIVQGVAISQAFLNREWYKVEVGSIDIKDFIENYPYLMNGHMDEVGFIDGIIGKVYSAEVVGDELQIVAAIFDNDAQRKLSIFKQLYFSIDFTGDLKSDETTGEYIVINAKIAEISLVHKPGNAGAIGYVIEKPIEEEEENQTISDELVLQEILKKIKEVK